MARDGREEGEGWTQLYGGSVNAVFRKGEVVRRRMSPASPAVHQVLRWLERHNFRGVPRLIRTTETSEFLTYIPGKPVLRPWSEEVKRESWMAELGHWLRGYHEVVKGFRLEGRAAFLWGTAEPEADMIVCHGDLGPWNFIQEGGNLKGVIDWDLARYGYSLDNMAELALEAVPLRPIVEEAMGIGTPKETLERRLFVLCEAYGIEPREVLEHVPTYLGNIIRETEKQSAREVEPFASFVKGGVVRELEDDKAHVESAWLT